MTFSDLEGDILSPKELAGIRKRCALHGKYEQAVCVPDCGGMPGFGRRIKELSAPLLAGIGLAPEPYRGGFAGSLFD